MRIGYPCQDYLR